MNAKAQNTNNPWLHRFAVLTAIITFLLLGVGGLVTSHEAGMSVPDWPTSYGYNMFALPIKFWKGGAFFEHSHRLLASGAGFLTTILAVWLWLKDSRRWMKWLGVVAFLLVVAQGVLGGLRVTLKMDNLGVIHGVVAQSFFILICAIALFTSRFWGNWSAGEKMFCVTRGLRTLVLATTVLIFCQLVLGATMRGQHAGLAIPDFPTAYGKIWPDTSPDAVAHYNAQRMDVNGENPITAFQIELQMFHRIVALTIGILVAFCGVAVVETARRRKSTDETRVVLACADCFANRTRRVDDLVQQGRRRGDAACAGRRAFARDRSALVHYCFWPTGGGNKNCSGKNNIRCIWNISGDGRKQVK